MSVDKASPVPVKPTELLYLPPPPDASFYHQEGVKEKMIRKTKENPFVPLGTLATAVVLTLGLGTLVSGKTKHTQLFMRLRVACQAFAVLAMPVGIYIGTKRKPKEP